MHVYAYLDHSEPFTHEKGGMDFLNLNLFCLL